MQLPRRQVAILFILLACANLLAWSIVFSIFRHQPLLVGLAALAYFFGLRHAVDADHIAAIDNVTRKLMAEKRRPLGIGLSFSLGHSTVVFTATWIMLSTAIGVQHWLTNIRPIAALFGTAISAISLLAIALFNGILLFHGSDGPPGGPLTRLCRPLFRLVSRNWHMYILGFLFGLGFDTATEISVLGMSANEAAKGLPIWSVLLFPLLFAAGMTLVDSTDGVLMLGAYGWALQEPAHRRIYNNIVTIVSILVALIIGGLEFVQLTGRDIFLGGLFQSMRFWGYGLIAFFATAWLAAYCLRQRASAPVSQAANIN